MIIRFGLIQLSCSIQETVNDRIKRGVQLARTKSEECDFLVFPELWPSGAFDIQAAKKSAQPLDGPLVDKICTIAQATGTWIHMGSFTEIDNGNFYNTSVVIDPSGEIAATYRKVHIFGFDGGEKELMSSGDSYSGINFFEYPIGLTTCYDLRFPELYRAMLVEKTCAFITVAGWPASRISQWKILNQARAIENQAWIIACNSVGDQGEGESKVVLGGYSMIVDPYGQIVAQADESESFLVADVDLALSLKYRQTFPVLNDRLISPN